MWRRSSEVAVSKVLVVANDVGAARTLRRVLHRAGYDVALAYDGRGALAVLQREVIDCLVCDPVLPGTFGTDLIEAARATLQRPDLRAILLRPLPDALGYELADAQPMRVMPDPYADADLITF